MLGGGKRGVSGRAGRGRGMGGFDNSEGCMLCKGSFDLGWSYGWLKREFGWVLRVVMGFSGMVVYIRGIEGLER